MAVAVTPSYESNTRESILIVDEEVISCELLQFKLQEEGFDVDIAHDGRKALDFPLQQYSLIIVDLMSKPFNGINFTEMVRRKFAVTAAVILVSQRAADDDIVAALDAGADDYIPKPYSARVLVARVHSVLRRRRMTVNRKLSNVLRYRDLVVDMGAGTASIAGESVTLTHTEHNLLCMFMRHRNQYFERCEIRLEAWDESATVSDRTVDVNISRLRKKLGEYGGNIVNRPGVGYGFIE